MSFDPHLPTLGKLNPGGPARSVVSSKGDFCAMDEKSAGAVVKKSLKKTMSTFSPSENFIDRSPLLHCAISRYEPWSTFPRSELWSPFLLVSCDLAGSGASMLFFPATVPKGGVYQGTVGQGVSD